MNELVQIGFDYTVLTNEQTQRTQDAEIRIIGRTQRTIVENGRDLLAVKQDIGHGNFLNWVQSIGISIRTADRWMSVAENFEQIGPEDQFENHALYLLSSSKVPESAREEAKQRATDGEKITEEIAKQIRDAHKAKEQAEEAERHAHEEAQLAQQQLFQIQQTSQGMIDQLNQQINALQQQIDTTPIPEVRTERVEVKVEVTPPEVIKQLEVLQSKVNTLTTQRDNLQTKAEGLAKEAQKAVLKRNEEERQQKIRQGWQKTLKDFHTSVAKLFTQLPGSVDAQVLEAEDWERLHDAKDLVRNFLDECDHLRHGPIVVVVDAE